MTTQLALARDQTAHAGTLGFRTGCRLSELLQLQLALRSANALTIDYPIHKADEAGSADDIAECDRDEVMDDARYCNKGGVETSRDTTVNGLQPCQGQK